MLPAHWHYPIGTRDNLQLVYKPVRLWSVGGNVRSWKKPMQVTGRTYILSTDSNRIPDRTRVSGTVTQQLYHCATLWIWIQPELTPGHAQAIFSWLFCCNAFVVRWYYVGRAERLVRCNREICRESPQLNPCSFSLPWASGLQWHGHCFEISSFIDLLSMYLIAHFLHFYL